MTRKTTRDAALSRLFGAEEDLEASGAALAGNPVVEEVVSGPKADSSSEGRVEVARKGGARPSRKTRASQEKELEPVATPAAPPGAESVGPSDLETVSPGPSGYIGLGRYVREGGVLERITPYVRPDQAEALRVAVARKRDPRGRDISQIVQTLLDEAGYRGTGTEGEGGP